MNDTQVAIVMAISATLVMVLGATLIVAALGYRLTRFPKPQAEVWQETWNGTTYDVMQADDGTKVMTEHQRPPDVPPL